MPLCLQLSISVPEAVNVVTTMLSKGYTLGKDTLSKAKELDEKYQVLHTAAAKAADIGKFLGHAAYSAGKAAVNSSYFAKGALMVSVVLDKAAKATADFGHRGNAGKK